MKILSFDMGVKTGYAFLDDGKVKAAGTRNLGPAEENRYVNFLRLVCELRHRFTPDMLAYEDVRHVQGNGGQVIQGCRGIVEAVGGDFGLLVLPINVSTAKKEIGGHGHADKDMMRVGVAKALGVDIEKLSKLDDNAVDAIAIALVAASRVLQGA